MRILKATSILDGHKSNVYHYSYVYILWWVFCIGGACILWLKFDLSANIGLSSLEKTTRVQNLQPNLAPCGQALVDTEVACWFRYDLQNFSNSSHQAVTKLWELTSQVAFIWWQLDQFREPIEDYINDKVDEHIFGQKIG